MHSFKSLLFLLGLSGGAFSNATEHIRNNIVDYELQGMEAATRLKSGSRQNRERAYISLKEAYNRAPPQVVDIRLFKEQLTRFLLSRYPIADLQSEDTTSDSPNDRHFLALMKLGVLGYYVLYLPESPSRTSVTAVFLEAFRTDGAKTYEVHRPSDDPSRSYDNVSVLGADEHVIDAISIILKNAISSRQTERIDEVLSLFEEQGRPSNLFKRIVTSNGPMIFDESQAGARYLLKVLKAQRPELLMSALNFDYGMHMTRPWWGPYNGSDMIRFFVQRTDQNLLRLLSRSGITNYRLIDENVFSVHSSEMDLTKYLQSNTRLTDAIVARALLSVHAKDDYRSPARKFLTDLARDEQGRRIVGTVARRCFHLDPRLVGSPEMAFLTEPEYANEKWATKQARLSYAGLSTLASLGLLTLEDVDFLVKEQVNGFSWATVLYKNNAYTVREAIQAVLKAHGYHDKIGLGSYLHERHGFTYNEDPRQTDYPLTKEGRLFPLWEYYGIAFNPHGIAPNYLIGNRRFTRLDDYREMEQSVLEVLIGFSRVTASDDCETSLVRGDAP